VELLQSVDDSQEWISRNEIRATVADHIGCWAAAVGDHDNLINLGLNSIRVMALAENWRKRGSDITFAQLADTPTVDAWYVLLSNGREDKCG
jgi:mycobactin phenyloxazoline synthetase